MTDQNRLGPWGFEPSIAGNVIFGLLFLVLTVVHIVLRIRFTSKFFNCVIAGGIFEVIGYFARAGANADLTSVGAYAIQSLFLLLAPILFAATCYMTLSRTISATGAENLSLVSPGWLTRLFVLGDILCFLIQAGGGAMQTINGSESLPKVGKWLVVVGLALQIIIFTGYFVSTCIFHKRLIHTPTSAAMQPRNPWKKILYVIYIASFLITIRNIVRIVEYVQGYTGWIITHEFMLWIFDGVPMAVLLTVMLLWHPGRLLSGYFDEAHDLTMHETSIYQTSDKLP